MKIEGKKMILSLMEKREMFFFPHTKPPASERNNLPQRENISLMLTNMLCTEPLHRQDENYSVVNCKAVPQSLIQFFNLTLSSSSSS